MRLAVLAVLATVAAARGELCCGTIGPFTCGLCTSSASGLVRKFISADPSRPKLVDAWLEGSYGDGVLIGNQFTTWNSNGDLSSWPAQLEDLISGNASGLVLSYGVLGLRTTLSLIADCGVSMMFGKAGFVTGLGSQVGTNLFSVSMVRISALPSSYIIRCGLNIGDEGYIAGTEPPMLVPGSFVNDNGNYQYTMNWRNSLNNSQGCAISSRVGLCPVEEPPNVGGFAAALAIITVLAAALKTAKCVTPSLKNKTPSYVIGEAHDPYFLEVAPGIVLSEFWMWTVTLTLYAGTFALVFFNIYETVGYVSVFPPSGSSFHVQLLYAFTPIWLLFPPVVAGLHALVVPADDEMQDTVMRTRRVESFFYALQIGGLAGFVVKLEGAIGALLNHEAIASDIPLLALTVWMTVPFVLIFFSSLCMRASDTAADVFNYTLLELQMAQFRTSGDAIHKLNSSSVPPKYFKQITVFVKTRALPDVAEGDEGEGDARRPIALSPPRRSSSKPSRHEQS